MKTFLDENFLLQSKTAEYLYHEHAKKMPVIDYHCHLDPRQIAEDIRFENLTQAWLYGDHYKWRAMRANGIDERFCTGSATDFEKFEKWAETVPYTLRNPLYHWTHLELKSYFEITDLLNPSSAKRIYDKASSLLNSKEYSVRGLMKKMNVEVVCTTDDPVDSLIYHQKIKADGFLVKVLPTWRPDAAMAVEDEVSYNSYLDTLSAVSEVSIITFNHLIEGLRKRHDFFASQGCRISDHGLETLYAEDYTYAEIEAIFKKVRSGKALGQIEI